MKALLVTGPGQVEVTDLPRPDEPAHALVAVELAGICGTDMKIVAGDVPVSYPRLLGHEMVGTVERAGPRGLHPRGTRVLVDPTLSCGHCYLCTRDRAHLCANGGLMGRDLDGGFAEFLSVAEGQLHAVPPTMSEPEASLLQVLGTCVHGQRLVDVFPGQVAVVVGLGVTGLMHLQLLRARGLHDVIGVSRSEGKRALGELCGASATVTPEGAGALIAEHTGGRGADLVVESAGKVETLRLAVELAGLGATVLGFGTLSATSGALPFYDLYYKELALINSRGARPRDYTQAIELASSGALQLAPLLSATYPLTDAEGALGAVAAGGDVLKVVFRIHDGE